MYKAFAVTLYDPYNQGSTVVKFENRLYLFSGKTNRKNINHFVITKNEYNVFNFVRHLKNIIKKILKI